MKVNKEFLIFFVPFLAVGIGCIYGAIDWEINILFKILLGIIGGIFLGLDAFAVLVEFVNWKYYKE